LNKLSLNSFLTLILIVFLTVGLVGMFTPFEKSFSELSSFNLVFTLFLVFYSFKNDLRSFFIPFISVYLVGFLFEAIGVNFGIVFGDYSYGKNLGLMAFNVPLLIGANWAVLTLGSYLLSSYIFKNKFTSVLASAILLVLFDFIMEPIAISLGFWSWKDDIIPFYNYFSWFIIGLITSYICTFTVFKNKGIVQQVFIAQFLFFLILHLR